MKARIRIAFTIDVEPGAVTPELLRDFLDVNVHMFKVTDMHVVARRGGKTLAEIGSAPKEKP